MKNNELNQWLVDYFNQHVIPLKRQYVELLHQHITLLNLYLHSSDLTADQRQEILNWINQLTRIVQSYSILYSNNHLEIHKDSLWCLFGAANKEEIIQRIDIYCKNIEKQSVKIKNTLEDITSISSLEKHLRKRKLKDVSVDNFIDDPTSHLKYA